jgi:D-alanyl-D-alanine carboxypeptidase/D-alanyl-D-alanine-endopeptidase (penicillin-binding protein 4)
MGTTSGLLTAAGRTHTRRRPRRPGHLDAKAAFLVVACLTVVLSCTASEPTAGPRVAEVASQKAVVPPAARQIMNEPEYGTARWLYYVADLRTGEVLLASHRNELVFTASTAKLLTVGTALDVLGPDYRVTTPVYATGPVRDGVVDGDLALVASGDLALGGRGATNDRFNFTFTADAIDHVYGDVAPNAAVPQGNPLAGLNDLARQVAAKGVTRVDGDVVIDQRRWQPFDSQEGVVPPVFVNDNLFDIAVTPAAAGETATVVGSPRSEAFAAVSQVKTVPGSDAAIEATADPTDPRRIIVTGTIGAAADPQLTVYRIPDAARWARTLFIEALGRAGVTVAANPVAASPAPPSAAYRRPRRLAALTSPPLREFGKMILATSYNRGANALMCQLAVDAESTDCLEGLKSIHTLMNEAGLVSEDVVLVDGQGADPASVTPLQLVRWLRWTQDQSWAAPFNAGLPVLGESGSLASAGLDSPARGKVMAKTGTSARPDPATGRVLFNVQGLAGFMKTDDGRTLVFSLSMSGATYPDVLTGLVTANEDVAGVAAAFQQFLSR